MFKQLGLKIGVSLLLQWQNCHTAGLSQAVFLMQDCLRWPWRLYLGYPDVFQLWVFK